MKAYVKRALAFGYLKANRHLMPVLEQLMALGGDKPAGPSKTPIFIIGAPRSGTTMTFQLIVSAFPLGYLTNTHCMVFGAPALASCFLRNRDRKIMFESKHGRTSGAYGPSECGEWWYRFFPRNPAYVTRLGMRTKNLKRFQRSLGLISRVEGRPLVFKNLYAGLRLDPIVAMFPEAIFIHVQRERFDNAVSLLEGRMNANGNFEAWWSVSPPGYEEWLEAHPAEQVMAQIELIERRIQTDVRNLGLEDQVLTVSYEDICADTALFLKRIQGFLASRNVTTQQVGNPPERFRRRRSNQLPKEILDRLKDFEKEPAFDV